MAIIKYKKGNSWISIPIYVNTGGEVLDYVSKAELESMGYISELKTINNQSLIGSGNINIAIDLSNYYTKSEVNGLIPSLNNYYKKSETYSQSEVNALIDSVNAGDVDLSDYYTKSQVDELIPDDYLTSSSLSGYATQTWVNNKNYAKAADIPTQMSELTNDLGYLTSVPSEYITSSELNSKLSSYAKTSAIPTAASDLTNDMGYLTSIPSQYITESELYRTVTYSQLVSLVNSSSLIPGALYAITDYSCIYYLYDQDQDYENSASDFEKIVVRAISNNKLDENASIIRSSGYVPIVECKYTIDNDRCYWTRMCTSLSPKGCIYYLKDANDIKAFYDFKHVRFPRYKVSAIGPHTTPNNGTNTIVSPYKAYAETSGLSWNDNRLLIGAGDEIEADLIDSIFDGTWMNKVEVPIMYITKLSTVDSSYGPLTTQAYLNSGDSWDPYMAWVPDMTSARGFGTSSRGSVSSYNTAKVTNSTTDYKMRYTFDYQGTDASERKVYGLDKGLVTSVNLENAANYYNNKLPNVVFAFSSANINNSSTFIQEVNLSNCACSHFALVMKAHDFACIQNLKAYTMAANLIIGIMQQVTCNIMQRCYINGSFTYVNLTQNFNRNAIFGNVTQINCKVLQDSIWYNSMQQYLKSGSTTWESVPDGWYSYDVSIEEWCGANIFGPMQYTKIRPHFNSNTFRTVYNKGNVFDSANQSISFGQIAYTHVGYGIGQGIKFPPLMRCDISRSSFKDLIGSHAYPSKLKDTTSFSKFFTTGIWWTDFRGADCYPATIADLSDSVVTYIGRNHANTNPRTLIFDSTKWRLISSNHNTVRSVTVTSTSDTLRLDTHNRYAVALLNKSKTLNVSDDIYINEVFNAICKNDTTSNITLTLPTSSPYIVLSEKTSVIIEPGEYVEVSVVTDGTNIFLRLL